MYTAFDRHAPKKPTNVSINRDLLARAKAMNINLSATLEAALAERVSARLREAWKEDNKSAIEAYNEIVSEKGTFSDDLRRF